MNWEKYINQKRVSPGVAEGVKGEGEEFRKPLFNVFLQKDQIIPNYED